MYLLFSCTYVRTFLIHSRLVQGGGAVSFDGAPSSRLLIERSILETNAVRVRQSDEADTPATVVVFTGGCGDGSQDEFGGYHAPVWRIDDGRKCSSSFVFFPDRPHRAQIAQS